MSKRPTSKKDLIKDSSISTCIERDSEGNPISMLIAIKGELSAFPNSSNSKLPLILKNGRMICITNPKYKIRLDALKELFLRQKLTKIKLPASRDWRYLVTLHLGKGCSRVDSHNLVKSVCDWLEDLDIIENDKFVDCFASWNRDFDLQQDIFFISIKPFNLVKEQCETLIRKMLQYNRTSQ